jgi:hypothetical protein
MAAAPQKLPQAHAISSGLNTMSQVQTNAPSRGIYLVANARSQEQCNNLIYSIRRCGCILPIRVIPYDETPMTLERTWDDVKQLSLSDFPPEGLTYVQELVRRTRQPDPGHLRRFLCWFGEFDEFLYSDNDIVALMNWEEMFPYLEDRDLVHADHEFTTRGRFNMREPERFEQLAGPGALELAITAGHFLCRRSPGHTADFLKGLAWMEAYPDVPVWNDQVLLHVTVVLAQWRTLNLCKPPYNWASSWAGDYKNPLDLIRTIQTERHPISHLHFSGGIASGTNPIDVLLYSNRTADGHKSRQLRMLVWEKSGLRTLSGLRKRAFRKAIRTLRGSK